MHWKHLRHSNYLYTRVQALPKCDPQLLSFASLAAVPPPPSTVALPPLLPIASVPPSLPSLPSTRSHPSPAVLPPLLPPCSTSLPNSRQLYSRPHLLFCLLRCHPPLLLALSHQGPGSCPPLSKLFLFISYSLRLSTVAKQGQWQNKAITIKCCPPPQCTRVSVTGYQIFTQG